MRALQLNYSVVALLIVTLLLGTVFTGCQTHPRAQREMALLRAEILDLEDQFYSMKYRYEAANRDLQVCRGVPVDGTYLGSTSIEGEYVDGGFVDGGFVDGEYVDGGFVDGEYVDGPIIESSEYGQPVDIVYDAPRQTGRYLPHATATLRDSARRLFGRSNMQAQSQPTQQFESTQRRSFGLFNGGGLDPMEAVQLDLDIPFADESNADYSPQDNVIFDDMNQSRSASTNGPAGGQPVTQIDIGSGSTRGEDVDGQPGHEGVVVLIQPKDRNGVLVQETGEVTVSLIDPSADGEGQRIGLWKFTPQEMRLFEVKDERSEQGYLLHLPWDGHVPTSQELLLYVRYWTNDGRRLETSTRLSIDPPATGYSPESPLIEGWTRRDPRWDKGRKVPAVPSQPSLLADDPRIPDLKNAGQAGARSGVKATPASSSIKRPTWRPSR